MSMLVQISFDKISQVGKLPLLCHDTSNMPLLLKTLGWKSDTLFFQAPLKLTGKSKLLYTYFSGANEKEVAPNEWFDC